MFKKNLAHLKAYDPGPSLEEIKAAYHLSRIIKLDSNENVYGASPKVRAAITSDALLPELYPDCRDSLLRRQLSEQLGIDEDHFLFSLGLDEMIVLASRAFLDQDSGIVMAWPTFYEYYCHAAIEGAETKKVPCDDQGKHDLEAMQAAIDEKTRIVWICNPNNPTGTYLNEQELLHFIDRVPEDVVIMLDEAYIDFVSANDFPDSLKIMQTHPNVLVLRTFSKSYGLASFRLGYAIGNPQLINEIDKVRPPFNNPRLSQVAALAALQDQAFMNDCVHKNQSVLKMVARYLDQKGIPYYPSQANFIFVKTDRAPAVAEHLKKQGFLINPFQSGVRITIGQKDQMEQFLPLLEQALEEQEAGV
ncbi:MAG: histidinol-phosphate transaminase [Sporolactobacillus sp.]